jgi:hypothetical protein
MLKKTVLRKNLVVEKKLSSGKIWLLKKNCPQEKFNG